MTEEMQKRHELAKRLLAVATDGAVIAACKHVLELTEMTDSAETLKIARACTPNLWSVMNPPTKQQKAGYWLALSCLSLNWISPKGAFLAAWQEIIELEESHARSTR